MTICPEERCTGCGACQSACPADCIALALNRAGDRVAIDQYVRHYPVEYLGDTVDSLVMALRSGLTATQVPVEMRPRQAGTPSNNPYKAAVYLVRSMFSLLVSLTRRPVKRNSLEDEK